MPNRSEFRPPNPRASITNKAGVATPLMVKYFNDMGSAFSKLFDRTVTSINGRRGDVELSNADVGLGNVDNTSDRDKPVSTAMNVELGGKDAAGTEKNLLDLHVDEVDPHPQYANEKGFAFSKHNSGYAYNGDLRAAQRTAFINVFWEIVFVTPIIVGQRRRFGAVMHDRTGSRGNIAWLGLYQNKSDTEVYPGALLFQEEVDVSGGGGIRSAGIPSNIILEQGIYWGAGVWEDPSTGDVSTSVLRNVVTRTGDCMVRGYQISGSSFVQQQCFTYTKPGGSDRGLPTTFPEITDVNVAAVADPFSWTYLSMVDNE